MTLSALSLDQAREHFGVREWGRYAPLAVRLLRSTVEADGCWLWTRSTGQGGYGHIQNVRPADGLVITHRASYELFVGPIPAGMHIDHLCRNRLCLRPTHLEAVTCKENVRRGLRGALKTHCPSGHAYTAENTIRLKDGYRACRVCRQANALRRTERRRQERRAS